MKRVIRISAAVALAAGSAVPARGLSALAAAGFAAALLPAPAHAQGDALQSEVRVRVIQAGNSSKKFDPQLEDLRKFLQQHKFSSFKQVIDETVTVSEGGTKGIGLLSGKNLNVTLQKLTPEKASIRLLLLGQTGQILDTTVSAGPHKLFFIAGPKYDDGVLFIAIEPHYDPAVVEQALRPNVGKNGEPPKQR